MQCLFYRCFCVEGEACVDFSRYTTWDNFQDLTAKLNKKVIESGIDLVVNTFARLLAILYRLVN
jgi:hypothetical protein